VKKVGSRRKEPGPVKGNRCRNEDGENSQGTTKSGFKREEHVSLGSRIAEEAMKRKKRGLRRRSNINRRQ